MTTEQDQSKIYVDRLRGEETETVQVKFPPDFLEVEEAELQFRSPISVKGQAYLAEDSLVLHFDIHGEAWMPCSICNRSTPVKIEVLGFYHIVPLKEIKGAVYDFGSAVREAVLLELPPVAECREGECPERVNMGKYLRSSSAKEEEYHPFENLKYNPPSSSDE